MKRKKLDLVELRKLVEMALQKPRGKCRTELPYEQCPGCRPTYARNRLDSLLTPEAVLELLDLANPLVEITEKQR